MCIKLILILIVNTMVTMALLEGQNFYEVTFMDDDSGADGDEVHCTIHSVHDSNGDKFTKFIAPGDLVDSEAKTWNEVNSAGTFEECASSPEVASSTMFRFDGSTCETSSTGYTRQKDACENLSGAEFVYLKE